MWFFSSENKKTSVRKSYISKYVKKIETIRPWSADMFWNILAFDEESKRKLLTTASPDQQTVLLKIIMNDFRVKFLLCLNGKFFDFKKKDIQMSWIYNCMQ